MKTDNKLDFQIDARLAVLSTISTSDCLLSSSTWVPHGLISFHYCSTTAWISVLDQSSQVWWRWMSIFFTLIMWSIELLISSNDGDEVMSKWKVDWGIITTDRSSSTQYMGVEGSLLFNRFAYGSYAGKKYEIALDEHPQICGWPLILCTIWHLAD